ncbi:MAG: hypothetical protein WA294_22515 [Acidobacteriaceae bacterium]
MTVNEGFPVDFTLQKIEAVSAKALTKLSAPEIAAYLRQNPSVADDLLLESLDKRFTPSTFLTGQGDEYRVGWFSRRGYECERRFATLTDAATDYVLFSLGRGRWTSPEK